MRAGLDSPNDDYSLYLKGRECEAPSEASGSTNANESALETRGRGTFQLSKGHAKAARRGHTRVA